MSDLISRQAAIDAVKKNTFRLTFTEEQNCEGHVAWSANAVYSDVMEGALLELPSAQPEPVTDCHGLTDDLISRAAAIDILYNFAGCIADTPGDWYKAFEKYKYELENLPSAQPEIIHCNSCKHWTQSTGKMKGYGLGRCDFHDADLVTCNGFCYWAERRNDE